MCVILDEGLSSDERSDDNIMLFFFLYLIFSLDWGKVTEFVFVLLG